MMKKFGIYFVLSICSHVIYGQIANFHTFSGQPLMTGKAYQGIEGTPYFSEDWRTGTVFYDNKKIENVQLKYNAYEDLVVIYYNNRPFIPDEKLVSGFEFTQTDESGALRYYTFKNGFDAKGVSKDDYLAVIYEGEAVLAEKIKVSEISVTPAVYGQSQVKQFILKKAFILIRNGAAEKFSLNRKSFLKEYPEQEARLKQYFKDNQVDFDNVDDLVNLMKFIESKA